jgi:DNA-binding response OmpR family regulator
MARQSQSVHEFGPYRIDAAKRLLLRDGEVVPLTPKCFEIRADLHALVQLNNRRSTNAGLVEPRKRFLHSAGLTEAYAEPFEMP